MNPNTEYERFTQEIYRQLSQATKVNAADVQHNVKREGQSGQKHQIAVYWEYEKLHSGSCRTGVLNISLHPYRFSRLGSEPVQGDYLEIRRDLLCNRAVCRQRFPFGSVSEMDRGIIL